VIAPLVLRSTYRRRAGANADSAWFGTFDLELASTSGASIEHRAPSTEHRAPSAGPPSTSPPSTSHPDADDDARDRTMVPAGDTPVVSATPHPRHVMLGSGAERHQRARLVGPTTAVAEVWRSVAELGRRAGWDVLDPIGADSDATPTTLAIVDELAEEAYDLDIAGGAITV